MHQKKRSLICWTWALCIRKFMHLCRESIIEDPKFLVGESVTWETGTMDGQKWESPETVEAVQKLAPNLPHLVPLLRTFFEGASITWKQFTSEFAPGGLIDEATADERELVWMPPTNDVNEGAFRILMHQQPHLTSLQYNAQAMYAHNNTQAFMEEKFQPEDYQYICQLDWSKLENKQLLSMLKPKLTNM